MLPNIWPQQRIYGLAEHPSPLFKTCYNNDDRIKAIMTIAMTELMAMEAGEGSLTHGPLVLQLRLW